MIVIVEFLSAPKRIAQAHNFSRVPCNGEIIAIGDDENYVVHSVYHYADAKDGEAAACIRVKD